MSKLHMIHAIECSNATGIRFIYECGLVRGPNCGVRFTNDIRVIDNRPLDDVCKKCRKIAVANERAKEKP